MRTDIDPALIAHLQTRVGVTPRVLIWISAKDRTTGAVETAGFSNHDDTQTFVVGGASRVYFGAGGIINAGEIKWSTGFNDNRVTMTMASLAPEVEQALRGYDPRLAPVEIHRVFLNSDTLQVIAAPHRLFKGKVHSLTETLDAFGGKAEFELKMSGEIERFGRTLATMHSDASIRKNAGDRFCKYVDVTAKVVDTWQ